MGVYLVDQNRSPYSTTFITLVTDQHLDHRNNVSSLPEHIFFREDQMIEDTLQTNPGMFFRLIPLTIKGKHLLGFVV